MPEPRRQYVLLHHVLADGHHWDLMLDQGESLATWQIESDPARLTETGSSRAIPARRIGAHRRAYLNYEGPISGGRGNVIREDKGTYELIEQSAAGWTVRLEGIQLRGIFQITTPDTDHPGVFQRISV